MAGSICLFQIISETITFPVLCSTAAAAQEKQQFSVWGEVDSNWGQRCCQSSAPSSEMPFYWKYQGA